MWLRMLDFTSAPLHNIWRISKSNNQSIMQGLMCIVCSSTVEDKSHTQSHAWHHVCRYYAAI